MTTPSPKPLSPLSRTFKSLFRSSKRKSRRSTPAPQPPPPPIPPPLDAIKLVVNYYRNDTEILKVICSLCKDWVELCRPHLFAKLSITNDNADAFVEILQSPSFTLPTTVESMKLSLSGETSRITAIMPLLPTSLVFQTLIISADPVDKPETDSLLPLILSSPLSSITALELYDFLDARMDDQIKFICSFPSLESLTLRGNPAGSISSPDSSITLPPNLRALRILHETGPADILKWILSIIDKPASNTTLDLTTLEIPYVKGEGLSPQRLAVVPKFSRALPTLEPQVVLPNPAVQKFLTKFGPGLKCLTLGLEGKGPVSIDISTCTSLESISLYPHNIRDSKPLKWISDTLAPLRAKCPNLRKVTFGVASYFSFYQDEPAWAELDRLFSYPDGGETESTRRAEAEKKARAANPYAWGGSGSRGYSGYNGYSGGSSVISARGGFGAVSGDEDVGDPGGFEVHDVRVETIKGYTEHIARRMDKCWERKVLHVIKVPDVPPKDNK